jgi:signal transduction histidine kinase
MNPANKIKNNLSNAGHGAVEVNRRGEMSQNKETSAAMQPAFSEPGLLAAELADQLLQAQTQLQRETARCKQAEKKLRTCQNRVRTLTSALLLTEERERRRLAQDLHDTVAQCLASCRYQLETLQANMASSPNVTQVGGCIDIIDQGIQQTRLLMFECYPWTLHESGLVTTLCRLAHRVQEAYGIQTECIGDRTPDTMDRDLRILLFRTIRELLFNVVKHAKAQHATISIHRAKRRIHINVVDDGIGFDIAGMAAKPGDKNAFGLFSIRERLGLQGGRLDLISVPGKGTRAAVVVPIKNCSEVQLG